MPTTFHQHTLSNGLTILAETDPAAYTAGVGFFVKTGTRDEDQPLMGVSHFLEHMMFKGTARRSAEVINREFDDLGANYNAYTSHDCTVYWAQVLPEMLPKAVDLLGDMLHPALREEDFTLEKNVILEEIGMYEDRPQWRLQDAIMEAYFAGHPLSYRVLGTKESVGALTASQMRNYFATHYCGDHITVAAAGKLDFDKLVDDLTRLTKAWAAQGAPRRYDPPQAAAVQKAMTDAKLTRHYVSLMSPGPSAQDPRRYAATILADVLGDSEGSRLYWALIDPGLADEADFSLYAGDQVGAFSAFASCDPDRAEQVQGLLIKTIDGLPAALNPEEVERAKNKVATHATLRGERPMGRMMNLGNQWLFLHQYVPLEVELERLMAVTPQDIRDLVAEMPFAPRTIVRWDRDNQRMAANISHNSGSLFRASIERMITADRLHDLGDYPMAIYLAGLAVECLLQAFALRARARHDAKHDLSHWLAKCPAGLQDAIKRPPTRDCWSEVVATWSNSIRYFSREALLGYLRNKNCLHRFRGDSDAKMRAYAAQYLELARQVQNKGLARWPR